MAESIERMIMRWQKEVMKYHCPNCLEDWTYGWELDELRKFIAESKIFKGIVCSKCKKGFSVDIFVDNKEIQGVGG